MPMQAAKVMVWIAGTGATAFGVYHLTQQLHSTPPPLDGAGNSGRSESNVGPSSSGLDHLRNPGTTPTRDLLLAAGGACGLLGVAGGAFGFHGLKRCASRSFLSLCFTL